MLIGRFLISVSVFGFFRMIDVGDFASGFGWSEDFTFFWVDWFG